MIRVVAPHFVAAVVLDGDRVTRWAPIVRYMRGWSTVRVECYARRKGWSTERL